MPSCQHRGPHPYRGCRHVLDGNSACRMAFTGRGQDFSLVCHTCTSGDIGMCAACYANARRYNDISGFVGTPELLERPSRLRFERDTVDAPGSKPLALAPIVDGERARWLVAGADGYFHEWDLDARTATRRCPLPPTIPRTQPITLRVSRDASLAAIANTRGLTGAVVDLATGATTLPLERGNYHTDQCNFSVAFVEHEDRTLVVHATEWCRLDISDARTGALLTARGPVGTDNFAQLFHCELHVSPGGRRIADTGWLWHPNANVVVWSVDRWIEHSAWESDTGASRRELCWYEDAWDQPLAWLDDDRVAVFGYGQECRVLPSACIYDAATGDLLRWFYGPVGPFVFDHHLVSIDDATGAAVWDVGTGHRLATCAGLTRASYHPGAKVFLSGDVAWRLCGHHLDAPWATAEVRALAESLRDDPTNVAVLADALEESGCDDDELLAHCRTDHTHTRRCWAIDRLR